MSQKTEYPAEVQEYLDVLNVYTESDSVARFDILHLYPQELAYPNGYYDAKFFRLIGFNTKTQEKRDLGRHDVLRTEDYLGLGYPKVRQVRIYVDGSTLVEFDKPVCVSDTQAASAYLSISKEAS